ncbi:MAG: tyrosine-type recombinase/integrase [Candidatus Thermoplasmatota archaeon]|mgnify:CR=1 FL=1
MNRIKGITPLPAIVARLAPYVGDHPYGRYIAQLLTQMEDPLRSQVTDYIVARLASGRVTMTAYLILVDISQYIRASKARCIEDLTKEAFRSHFREVAKRVSNRQWYGAQRHVVNFLTSVLGAEAAAKLAPASVATNQWGSNNPTWYQWSDLRRLWLKLNLRERAMFSLLAGTGVNARELLGLKVEAVSFESDGLCMIELPCNGRREARTVGVFFGEKSMAALVQQVKRDSTQGPYLFPDPRNPEKPMQRSHLTYLLRTWSARAGIPTITASGLQTTFAGYLLGRKISMQIVAHQIGIRDTSRLNDLHNHVLLAQAQGHLAGQPSFHADVIAGLVPCEACGHTDNGLDAHYCGRCGSVLREEALDEESLLKAQIQNRFAKWLDLRRATPTTVAEQALAEVKA